MIKHIFFKISEYEKVLIMSKKKFLHRILLSKKRKYIYPLLDQGLSAKDLNEGIKVLKSGRITMGKKNSKFLKINSRNFLVQNMR